MQKILLYLSLLYNGKWSKIYDDLDHKRLISVSEVDAIVNNFSDQYLTIIDKLYPDSLKQIYQPPFCIFLNGNIELLNLKRIGLFVNEGQFKEDNLKSLSLDICLVMIYEKSQAEMAKKILNLGFNLILITSNGVSSIDDVDLICKRDNLLIISEMFTSELNASSGFDAAIKVFSGMCTFLFVDISITDHFSLSVFEKFSEESRFSYFDHSSTKPQISSRLSSLGFKSSSFNQLTKLVFLGDFI